MNGRCLYADNVQLNTEATIFIVSVVRSGIASWGAMLTHGQRNQDVIIEQMSNGGSMQLQTCNDNLGAQLAYSLNTPTVWTGRYTASGTTRTFWKTTNDGTGSASTATTTATQNCISTGSKRIRVGCSDNNELFNGYYAEVIYYNAALSDLEMQSITNHLFGKWLV